MDGKALESFLGSMILDFHNHLMYPTNISSICRACRKIEQTGSKKGGYTCKPCNLYVHKNCVEINNLYRHKHPLKLLEFILLHDSGKKCFVCEGEVHWMFYHCFICGFTLCTICTSKPLVIDVPKKVHKHSLTQVMINVSFNCDACGVYGHGYPCMCLQCCFIIHEGCIRLPRVIHINRHDHRVFHTYLLSPGKWICGVCRKDIDRLYGGYSCSICRYAVHSKCATRNDVWDGVELEDVPEDGNKDLDPFEVISEGLIKHFIHEHDLRLVSCGNNDHCCACTLPIYYDPYYSCMQCHFILHETCASFPRTKRHELHHNHFTLYPNPKPGYGFLLEALFFRCHACYRESTGFRYTSENVQLDVRCATISGDFLHGFHPHSLSIPSGLSRVCSVCDLLVPGILTCVVCLDFCLCFKCATIPNEAIHKYDKHTLYLRYYGKFHDNYWCDICEKPTNPKKWFYSCDKCGSTLHIDCVLGTNPYIKPGLRYSLCGYEFQVVSNNHMSRPLCQKCSLRCVDVFFIKSMKETYTSYLCSTKCFLSFVCANIFGLQNGFMSIN